MGTTTELQPTEFSIASPSADPPADEQVLGQYIPLLYHYNMLQDENRVGAFREAIQLIVQPGMRVLELGGGTGILSSFAARRGAKVTCVERNPELVSTAQRFVRDNDLDTKIDVIQADAMEFVPDEPVDVVICEMLHVGLLREKQAQVINAFKRNHQAAFGPQLPVFIPEASVLMVQPVQQSFNFSGFHAPVPVFQPPLLDQPRTSELSELSPYSSIAYDELIPTRFAIRQAITTNHDGNANAIRFLTQNVLAIDMPQERAITWPNQCLVLPIEQPFQVTAGRAIEIEFEYAAGGSVESLAETLKMRALHQGHADLNR